MDGRTDGRTDLCTDVHDGMAIKPNFLASMGYHIFLTMVLREGALARSSANTRALFSASRACYNMYLLRDPIGSLCCFFCCGWFMHAYLTKKQKENFLGNITWSEMEKQNVQAKEEEDVILAV